MIIVLMGYMASGKSTIGKVLSKKLNYNFIDLDEYVEKSEGKTISEIFSESGEIYFRKKESQCLKKLVSSSSELVLSLGGGTPCYANNINIINGSNNTLSIYLKASIGTIIDRFNAEPQTRPLIAHLESEEELTEFVGKHLFERNQFYNQANNAVATDNLSLNEIVENIVLKLF